MEKDRCGLMSHRGRRGLNNNNQRASTQMSYGTPLDDNNNNDDNGTVYFIVGRMGALKDENRPHTTSSKNL